MSEGGAGLSGGEIGGIFSGIVLLLGLVGGGIKWLIGWRDRQRDDFYQRNRAWEEELKAREARLAVEQQAHFSRIEARLSRAERRVEAVLNGYYLIANRLRAMDPRDPALREADEILKAAFRLEPLVPEDMIEATQRIDRAMEGRP